MKGQFEPCSGRLLQIFCLYVLTFVCLLFRDVNGAHSIRRLDGRTVVQPRYDRSITTFSPDGRLAQVEYGMEASQRGSAVIAVHSNEGVCVVLEGSSAFKVHRIDHHAFVITTGLSGDGRYLAQYLRTASQNHRLSYGEAPTIEHIASMTADYQHQLTRYPGARPLGCTAIVVGMDSVMPVGNGEKEQGSNDGSMQGSVKLFRTDPGGVMEEFTTMWCSAGAELRGATEVLRMFQLPVASEQGIRGLATRLAETVLNKMDRTKAKSQETIDVWTFEKQAKHRGGMRTSCHRRLRKDNVHDILSSH